MLENNWANPSTAGAAEASQMAAFMEERSQREDQRKVNQALCERISPQPGEHWLEVGSGSGTICRMLASHLMPGGSITGVDISRAFLALANQLARDAHCADRIYFQQAEAENLPYPDGVLDGVFAARLLLHLAHPLSALREMRRVLKPGGRLVLMDWDFGTVAVDHSDRKLTRKILDWRCDHRGGDNWSGRRLYGWMKESGFHFPRVSPFVSVAQDRENSLTQSLYRAAEAARQDGAISIEEQAAWVRELDERLAQGVFLAFITYLVVRSSLD